MRGGGAGDGAGRRAAARRAPRAPSSHWYIGPSRPRRKCAHRARLPRGRAGPPPHWLPPPSVWGPPPPAVGAGQGARACALPSFRCLLGVAVNGRGAAPRSPLLSHPSAHPSAHPEPCPAGGERSAAPRGGAPSRPRQPGEAFLPPGTLRQAGRRPLPAPSCGLSLPALRKRKTPGLPCPDQFKPPALSAPLGRTRPGRRLGHD